MDGGGNDMPPTPVTVLRGHIVELLIDRALPMVHPPSECF